jgi:hypothetical protein
MRKAGSIRDRFVNRRLERKLCEANRQALCQMFVHRVRGVDRSMNSSSPSECHAEIVSILTLECKCSLDDDEEREQKRRVVLRPGNLTRVD